MKILFLLVFVTSTLMAAQPAMETEVMNKVMDDQFEAMSQGMTPAQKIALKAQIEEAKKALNEFATLSPEEQKKRNEETLKPLTAEEKKKIKESFEKMSPEDKKMFDIMSKNLKNQKAELNDPKSEASRKMRVSMGYESDKTIDQIVDSPDSTSIDLYYAANAIGKSKTIIEDAENKLIKISKFPNNNSQTHIALAYALSSTKSPVPNAEKIFRSIIVSPKNDSETISKMLMLYYDSEKRKLATPETIKLVMNSGRVNNDVIVNLARAIVGSMSPLMQKSILLDSLVSQANVDKDTLRSISSALLFSNGQIPNVDKIYIKIIKSPLMDKQTLDDLRESVMKTDSIVGDRKVLLDLINLAQKQALK